MINEEKKIIEIFGKKRPFGVPEGYFDSLTEQVMSQIPTTETEVAAEDCEATGKVRHQVVALHIWQRLPLRKIAAAVGVAVLLGGGIHFGLQWSDHQAGQMAQKSHQAAAESVNAAYSEDATFDQVADYTMMDSQDFYAQLVAEN